MTMANMQTNEDGLTLEAWMAKVDGTIMAICGLTSGDIADWGWWDAWADGLTPDEAAECALEEDFPAGAGLLDLYREGWRP